MRAHGDSANFQNIAATTSAFKLSGGVYVVDVVAAWGGGSVTLQRLGPDGATYITAATALSADGTTDSLALPAGQYRLSIATAAGVFASVMPVPGE